MLDSFTAAAAGGKLRVYTGSRPATTLTAIGAVTQLAELTMGSPAFGAAVGGVLTANAVTSDTAADATGTAGWARLWDSAGTTALADFTVTATGGGGNITFPTLAFVATVTISMTSFTASLPIT